MKKEFKFNKNNKIELTKEQLKSLLDDIYWEGYNNGKSSTWTYTTPNWTPYTWTTTTATSGITSGTTGTITLTSNTTNDSTNDLAAKSTITGTTI